VLFWNLGTDLACFDMRPRSQFERRKNRRIATPTGLWVSCKFDKHRATLRVQDISAFGALIETKGPAIGTRFELLLSVPEGEIRLLAVVRSHSLGKGTGVEFVSMDSGAFDLLLKLVKRLSA